jgi:hypothetical protein
MNPAPTSSVRMVISKAGMSTGSRGGVKPCDRIQSASDSAACFKCGSTGPKLMIADAPWDGHCSPSWPLPEASILCSLSALHGHLVTVAR